MWLSVVGVETTDADHNWNILHKKVTGYTINPNTSKAIWVKFSADNKLKCFYLFIPGKRI